MSFATQDTLELSKQAMDIIKSRYLLCILVSQRIHQLEMGAQPTIDVDPEEYASPKQFLNLSLREIVEGNMDLEQLEDKST